MREQLLGYVLNAAEADERAAVEERLQADPSLRSEMELLTRSLDPLRGDDGPCEPPAGLAERCCGYVRTRAEVMPAALSRPMEPAAVAAVSRPWSWLDYSVAGAIALAVMLLLVPAIYHSRVHSRLVACTNNLKDVGMALASYRERHRGEYPFDASGRVTAAGVWAPALVSDGALADDTSLICPSTDAEAWSQFRVPRLEDLHGLKAEELTKRLPKLSGSYGFTLGYRDENGVYCRHRQPDGYRSKFAVVADTPGDGPSNSLNHGGEGQNVLFEDGHVEFLKDCQPDCGGDDIFRNDQGKVGPGTHANDSVIVPSHVSPE